MLCYHNNTDDKFQVMVSVMQFQVFKIYTQREM